jgi:hypothetical protein
MNCPECGRETRWLVGKNNCQHCGWRGHSIDREELHAQVKEELLKFKQGFKHETKPTTEDGDCDGGACRGL